MSGSRARRPVRSCRRCTFGRILVCDRSAVGGGRVGAARVRLRHAGPTSTVVDEPASVSDVVDLDGPGDESSDLPGCAAGAPSWPPSIESLSVEVAVSLGPSEVPSAPGPPADGESLVVSGFAHAIPAGAAMADPMPNATARAPTRPTNCRISSSAIPGVSNGLPAVAVALAGQCCGLEFVDVSDSLSALNALLRNKRKCLPEPL